VARGAVNTAGNVSRTKRMIQRAMETQLANCGFSFVEILTMCPTGWFIETHEAPDYLGDKLAAVHVGGVLKDRLAEG
jgi:2-oxoglutarate/2-oxoacid ferredoxin oxidoreductase subunit beta